MDASAYLERAARLFGNNVAVRDADRELTYRQLHDEASRVASGLLALGLKRGDHVVDARWNSAESVVFSWAITLAGLVWVPLTPRLSAGEFAHLVENANARAFLTEAVHIEAIEAVWSHGSNGVEFIVADGVEGALSKSDLLLEPLPSQEPAQLTDLYALRYTGGTTGLPKAARQTHGAFLAHAAALLLDFVDLREDDIVLPTQPFTHGGGIYTLPSTMRGATQILRRKFDVDDVLDTIERERVTVVKIVPTILYRLLEAQKARPRDLSSLRLIGYGAAPMPEALLRQGMELLGCDFAQTYGSAAAPATIATLDVRSHRDAQTNSSSKRLRSVGRPYSTTDVVIVDEDRKPLTDGEIGEVSVSGVFVTDGFWNDPAETAKSVDNGTVYTGDLGYMEEGFLYLVGRQNDVVISGGFNVYPAEVEQALISIDGVLDAAVTCVSDLEWGEKVVAGIVLRPGFDLESAGVKLRLRELLAGYKCPKHIELFDALPLTSASKVDRKAVRAEIEERMTSLLAESVK
ncbi:AMP-binding protein [Rhodococcus fascians]|nr:AMP-binding protein [Rhodococcus fascians]MBY3999957.1 AMP-binding protein [Rhodococcus fascians]MBY4005140.1 AMP-binding protein [Rhodococcus fascians]MBY4010301.1 AMP-binding protein [Rhodococcus fascians]MBY4020344.1 AMP-binding protein [Rhodococcus fascians]